MKLEHFEVRVERVPCPSLEGNPLGDPSTRELPVILPKDWERSGKRYPVLEVLAGFGSAGPALLNWHGWTPSFPERLDRLRAEGRVGDMIVVLPDAFTRYGGSQYLNSTATGRYADMTALDLIAWVDASFPTLASARHRAVAGKSSGGFGALTLAMEHPEVYSAVACHSGDMYFEYCYLPDFPRLLRMIDRHRGLDGFLRVFESAPKKTTELFLAMNIVAMASAYSPSLDGSDGIDLPVDSRTGAIRSEVWDRWLARDPVRASVRCSGVLRSLRLLFLDCGRQDQFHLQYGLRILSETLDSLGVPHVKEEFDDDHSDTSYRWESSLPRIWEAIRPDP